MFSSTRVFTARAGLSTRNGTARVFSSLPQVFQPQDSFLRR